MSNAEISDATVLADGGWWTDAGKVLDLELRGFTYRTRASFADRETGQVIEMTGTVAKRLHALSRRASAEGAVGVKKPRLTEAAMRAACKAHYGSENIDGVSMTVDGIDWNFRQAFKRMWHGAWSALHPQAQPHVVVDDASAAARDVLAERHRQMSEEGWTAEHDDSHTDGSLALAAICYAAPVKLYVEDRRYASQVRFVDPWPGSWAQRWDRRYRYGERHTNPGNTVPDPETFTPAERRDLLVKSAAMLIAEIERLDRAALSTKDDA